MTTPNLGLSLTSEAAGSAITFLDWRLLQDGTLSSNMTILDSAYGSLSASVTAITGSSVTGGNLHDHLGGDGATILHSSLSGSGTNTHTTIDSFIASKGVASGLAQLSASGSVVENPENSTTTRTASKIPISNTSGFLDKWIEYKKSGTIINPNQIYTSSSRIVLMRADSAVYITRVHVSTNTSGYTISGSLVYADDTQSFSNATKILTCDAAGTFTATDTTGSSVTSGKYIYYQMNENPNSAITSVFLEVYYKYAA